VRYRERIEVDKREALDKKPTWERRKKEVRSYLRIKPVPRTTHRYMPETMHEIGGDGEFKYLPGFKRVSLIGRRGLKMLSNLF